MAITYSIEKNINTQQLTNKPDYLKPFLEVIEESKNTVRITVPNNTFEQETQKGLEKSIEKYSEDLETITRVITVTRAILDWNLEKSRVVRIFQESYPNLSAILQLSRIAQWFNININQNIAYSAEKAIEKKGSILCIEQATVIIALLNELQKKEKLPHVKSIKRLVSGFSFQVINGQPFGQSVGGSRKGALLLPLKWEFIDSK